ncbi:MAG TPA: hypothetical protein VJL59_17410 [Anaerolineales bacterium]|nr:hypothetical protein [Anaerolineales bacterium]
MSDKTAIDFLRAGNQSVVMVDGVPMEHRYAGELMAVAQRYYIEHCPGQLRAILCAQGLEPKF